MKGGSTPATSEQPPQAVPKAADLRCGGFCQAIGMLPLSSIAAMATAPKCSTTSRTTPHGASALVPIIKKWLSMGFKAYRLESCSATNAGSASWPQYDGSYRWVCAQGISGSPTDHPQRNRWLPRRMRQTIGVRPVGSSTRGGPGCRQRTDADRRDCSAGALRVSR